MDRGQSPAMAAGVAGASCRATGGRHELGVGAEAEIVAGVVGAADAVGRIGQS